LCPDAFPAPRRAQAHRGAGRERDRAELEAAASGTLVKAVARAWRWQGMLEEGRFASVRDLAEAERVSLSYISRILRLTLLAPDLVERILDGRPAPQLAELMQPFPVAWERQRTQFCAALMKPDEAGVLG
jgi:hypothetical protein